MKNRKVKNLKVIFIIVLLIVISSTIAYLYSTDTFQNIFVAASYKVTVVETFESPTNWKPGDTTPKTVTLKNEGTVPIKVRVKLEEEWKDSNGEDLPLIHNDENVSIINFDNEEDYIYKDGYYYYDLPLEPGETTSSIIESVTFNPNYSGTITCTQNNDNTHNCSSSDSGYEGGTYKLKITIEGVQEDYYVQAWNLSGEVFRQTLYNVLKRETESNGLAREFTGNHHDSFIEQPSQKIYHWYASTDSEGTEVQDKNNVIFGDQCWQMIRTTDTGGVKMIYNGEVENNQCLNTRGTHVGYDFRTTQTLNGNYWYGTDYTYDSINKSFALSGEKEQKTWNATNGPNLIGKYTCKSTSATGTCTILYLIESYNTASSAYVIPLNSNSHYSQFGYLTYGVKNNSIADVGYMTGDIYSTSTTNSSGTENFTATQTILNSTNTGTYWYADSVSYSSTTGYYSLVNPVEIQGSTNYESLPGKYTFIDPRQGTAKSNVYYIIAATRYYIYYKQLSNGELLSAYEPMIFGDSITDNGYGTYTINNPTSITLSDWYENYTSYKNKYTCNDNSLTCSNPRYLTASTSTNYTYVNAFEKIMIGKGRSGTTLIDTLLVRKDELLKNRSSYSSYKYTCNNDNAGCTDATLRLIYSFSSTGYTYIINRYFGSSVTWDGTNYILVDSVGVENYNSLAYHHYFCPNPGDNICSTVSYVYYYAGSMYYYITLRNGITTVSKALDDMLTKNINNSPIKTGIDCWYKHYLLEDYDDYIEDVIYCNDRSILSLGGWDDNGGNTNSYLYFKGSNLTDDLSCTNITDQFSVSNDSAKLPYKVGLISSFELSILNNNNIRKTGKSYWAITPHNFYYISDGTSNVRFVESGGSNNYDSSSSAKGARPTISLKPGIEYSSGDGSMANPYVVDTD